MTTTSRRYETEQIPGHLVRVPGVLGQLAEWIEACAVRSAPALSLGASIATLGTLAGRWYRSPTGLRANVYLVGLARSGAGKEVGRSCALSALSRSGCEQLCGTDDVASAAGLLKVLYEGPVRLFCLDEIGLMLEAITSKGAGTHEREILSTLMRLHSVASTSWRGKAYAERKTQTIEQPHCCVWGTSTPDRLWGALSGSHVVDGFLNRLLIIPHVGIGVARTPTAAPDEPPADLLAVLAAIGSGELSGVGARGSLADRITSATRTASRLVPATSAAARELDRIGEAQARQQAASSCPEAWSRLREHSIRLALVCALSLRPESPTIDEEAVRWGGRLAWWCTTTAAREAEERIGDTDEQRAAGQILAVVRKAGGRVAYRTVVRATWRTDRRHRDAALRTLIDAGRLSEVSIQGGRRGPAQRALEIPPEAAEEQAEGDGAAAE